MNHDRRIDIGRRVPGDRHTENNSEDYKGPEKRSTFDRRDYNDRRNSDTAVP